MFRHYHLTQEYTALWRVVATFPTGSHPPIVYPLAQLNSSRSKDAAAFRGFLLSQEGQAIFRRYGFTAP